MHGRVLIIAGSDSGGGAGIQADIKTVTMLDAYAATAITALTAQNTKGVFGVIPVPPDFIAQQMRVVLEDIGAVYVDFSLPQGRVSTVTVGMPVKIATDGPSPLTADGAISAIDPTIDSAVRTIKLRATLPNTDSHFWPGQFVKVRLE